MPFPLNPLALPPNTLDPRWVAEDIFWHKTGPEAEPNHHCKQTALLALPHVARFRNAVDIGCRDGEFTRYLQQNFAHVYGFDARRRKQFPHNVDTNKVTCFICALGDEQGEITMYGGTHDPTHAIPFRVPCFPLDSFSLWDVDFIKIDVEGFERRVLMGAERTIGLYRPTIVIEQNEAHLPGEPPFAARQWLEARGYQCVAVCDRGWDHVMVPQERA